MHNGLLILEDGTYVKGKSLGPKVKIFGEIVFNTSMTGYEESFTDPSYASQLLLMTYPIIGNYGFNKKNFESDKPKPKGIILKNPTLESSRGQPLVDFIKKTHIPCLYDVDTRALTLRIRNKGTMKAMLITGYSKIPELRNLIEKIKNRPYPDTKNLVNEVTCKKIIYHPQKKGRKKIILIDCGVKYSIIKNLRQYATVIQVPFNTTSKTIKKIAPHGIVISNGPGNPEHPVLVRTTIKTITQLLGQFPIFGICLGHQILGRALGLKTYKLKFGHRGSNHAVKNCDENKIYITSQNHGYALHPRFTDRNIVINWVNVNDDTIEGFYHKKIAVSSVQFHPEAAPGPNDTQHIFQKFLEKI